MTPEIADSNWLQWILTGLVGIGGVFMRLIHGRVGEVEKAGADDRDKLWAAQSEATKDFNAFRDRMLSDMASKTDLREMESRLMNAIRSK